MVLFPACLLHSVRGRIIDDGRFALLLAQLGQEGLHTVCQRVVLFLPFLLEVREGGRASGVLGRQNTERGRTGSPKSLYGRWTKQGFLRSHPTVASLFGSNICDQCDQWSSSSIELSSDWCDGFTSVLVNCFRTTAAQSKFSEKCHDRVCANEGMSSKSCFGRETLSSPC